MTRSERWGPWAATVAVAFAFLSFMGTGIYSVHHQRLINAKLCTQTVENREGVRITWEAARDIVQRGQTTQEGRERTNLFFNAILEKIPPLECVDNKPAVKEEK